MSSKTRTRRLSTSFSPSNDGGMGHAKSGMIGGGLGGGANGGKGGRGGRTGGGAEGGGGAIGGSGGGDEGGKGGTLGGGKDGDGGDGGSGLSSWAMSIGAAEATSTRANKKPKTMRAQLQQSSPEPPS